MRRSRDPPSSQNFSFGLGLLGVPNVLQISCKSSPKVPQKVAHPKIGFSTPTTPDIDLHEHHILQILNQKKLQTAPDTFVPCVLKCGRVVLLVASPRRGSPPDREARLKATVAARLPTGRLVSRRNAESPNLKTPSLKIPDPQISNPQIPISQNPKSQSLKSPNLESSNLKIRNPQI